MLKLFTIVHAKATLPCLLLLWLGASAFSFGQTTHYVKAGASGTGSSWADASGDLQAMIDASSDGDAIWVAAGTYTPAALPDGCENCSLPRDASFVLKDGVSIYGGFPATGNPGLADRNPASFTTILSGELDNDSDPTNNARHVVISVDDISVNTRLDGITIRGGYADPEDNYTNSIYYDNVFIPYQEGGGLYLTRSSIKLNTVVFTNNTAHIGGGAFIHYDEKSETLRASITSCTFVGNTSDPDLYGEGDGGGGLYENGTGTLIKDSYFGNNQVKGINSNGGGGLYSSSFGDLTIEHCVFEDNVVENGVGGAFYAQTVSYTLTNSQFRRNRTLNQNPGGAIFDNSFPPQGGNNDDAIVRIDSCLFEGNGSVLNSTDASQQTDYGGGIYFNGWFETHLTNCVFQENSANYGGAVMHNNFNNLHVTDCVFKNNAASDYGIGFGGAVMSYSPLTLERCVFANNVADYFGGAIYMNNTMQTVNCLFVGNSAPYGGAVNVEGNDEFEIRMINSTIAYNTAEEQNLPARIQKNASVSGTAQAKAASALRMRIEKTARLANSPKDVPSQRELAIKSQREAKDKALLARISANLTKGAARVAAVGQGGGIYNSDAFFYLTNSILWGNTAAGEDDPGYVQLFNTGGVSFLTNSIVQDGLPSGSVDQGGNSTADPQFTNAADPNGADDIFATADDGLKPTASSPAFNAGAMIEGVPANDITKASRSGNPDIGAYEAGVDPCSSPLTAVTATIAPSSVVICPGSSVTLTASGAGNGGSYRWSTNETTASIIVMPGMSQAYSVTATSTSGCSGTATAMVSVTSPVPPAPPTLSASGRVVCEGANVSVSATVSSTPDSYQWYKDGASLGTAQQGSTLNLYGVTPAQAGSYVLVITKGCGSATSTSPFTLTVNPLPTVTIAFPASATVSPGPVITVPVGQGLNYQVFGGGVGGHYHRIIVIDRISGYEIRATADNGDGIFPLDRQGPYTITVTDAKGCSRTVTGVIQKAL